MRNITLNLKNSIQSGSSTLCRIWTITRGDGAIYRFTDLDENVVYSGQTYYADTSFQVSNITTSIVIGAGRADFKFMFGTNSSISITKDDLRNGKFDNAKIVIELIDWKFPSYGSAVLLSGNAKGPEGTNKSFGTFEVVGTGQRGLQSIGLTVQAECDASLYDVRCGVNKALHSDTGVVTAVQGRRNFIIDLAGNPADYVYSFGLLEWTTGANTGITSEVLTQYSTTITLDQILLALNLANAITIGDAFTIYKGCDKRPITCFTKFNNIRRFRGFPYVPGPDLIEKTGRPLE